MYVTCNTNGGFEDQLTTGGEYAVKEIGENSYLIENDQKEQRWYGQQNFKVNTL